MTMTRAPASGIALDRDDVSIAKAMLARGDRQHDIAAWFGVNGGRIAEIACGQKYRDVPQAPLSALPPAGPYLTGRETHRLIMALDDARNALDHAERSLRSV